MKRFLILALLALLIPSVMALPDLEDQLKGDAYIRNAGAPWIDDEGKIYFGAGKDFSLGYENAYDKLFLNGSNAGLYFNTDGDITFYTADPTNDSIDFGTYPITAAGLAGFTNTNYGLNESGGKAGINLSADMGLAFDTGARAGALKVKNGDGIDLGSAGVEVDVGDLIGDGIRESTSPANNFEVNVTGYKGLEIGTGANDSELMVEVDSGLQLTSSGIGVKLSDTSLTAAGSGMSITPGAISIDIVGGGTAGNFTLTGAALDDELISVLYFNATTGNVSAITDLTAEFTIPDTNILNQSYGGTDSSNGYLQVFWMDRTD
jgi:hypothetical protein